MDRAPSHPGARGATVVLSAQRVQLKTFTAPTLIAWGDDDVFFPKRWAKWLGETIPGTKRVEILPGARLFLAEERADEFSALLRAHWAA